MAQSFVQYVAGGTDYSVPFQYISKAHIKATVAGVNATFSWVSDGIIRLSSTPTVGAVVEVSRVTPSDTRLVDFVDGSILAEADLDLSSLQLLFIAQEAADRAARAIGLSTAGLFDARGIEIANAGAPTQPSSVTTRQWTEAAIAVARNSFSGEVAGTAASLAGRLTAGALGATVLSNIGVDQLNERLDVLLEDLFSNAPVLKLRSAAKRAGVTLAGDGVTEDGTALSAIAYWHSVQRELGKHWRLDGENRTYYTAKTVELRTGFNLSNAVIIVGNPNNVGNNEDARRGLFASGVDSIYLNKIKLIRQGQATIPAVTNSAPNGSPPIYNVAELAAADAVRSNLLVNSAAIFIGGGKGHFLQDVEVTGGGAGSGIRIVLTTDTVVDRITVQGITYNYPACTDDAACGFSFDANINFQGSNIRVRDILGNGSERGGVPNPANKALWTRGIAGSGNSGSLSYCQVSNVDQGFDLISKGLSIAHCEATDCWSFGFKQANAALYGHVHHCVAKRCGFTGFIVSPNGSYSATDENGDPLRAQFLFFDNNRALDIGTSNATAFPANTTTTGWGQGGVPPVSQVAGVGPRNSVTAGIHIAIVDSGPSYQVDFPRGVYINGFFARDAFGRMKYGAYNAVSAPNGGPLYANKLTNFVSIGQIVQQQFGFDDGLSPSLTAITQVGPAANRCLSISSFGQTSFRFDDNALTDGLTWQNASISGASQGLAWRIRLGSVASGLVNSGSLSWLTTDDYSTTAKQCSALQVSTRKAGSDFATFTFDAVNGNASAADLVPSGAWALGGSTRRWSAVWANTMTLSPGIGTVLTPANNGDLTLEATSNTSVKIKLRGTDGVVREHTLTLS